MATISVRPATPADVHAVLGFIRELAAYERAPEQAVATAPLLHEALFGPRPACEALMGEVGGTPRGFALFFHNFSTWTGRQGLYLEDLYVLPEFRGLGLGLALFARVAAIAVERGCPRFEWAVLDWNTPAIDFYRRLGAVPMNEWTVYRLRGEALQAAAARATAPSSR
jgi:GNAT superfamily N-acetyltransferase